MSIPLKEGGGNREVHQQSRGEVVLNHQRFGLLSSRESNWSSHSAAIKGGEKDSIRESARRSQGKYLYLVGKGKKGDPWQPAPDCVLSSEKIQRLRKAAGSMLFSRSGQVVFGTWAKGTEKKGVLRKELTGSESRRLKGF